MFTKLRTCKFKIYNYLLILLAVWSPSLLHAEGTKEIQPVSSAYGYVQLDPAWNNFALYGCAVEERLHIRICNVGEKIYYGFNQPNKDVKYRIKDPNGNIVVAQATVPFSGSGYIGTYNQAKAGPSVLAGGGYTALSYTPTMTGDYYIEFLLPTGNPRRTFTYFDITVASASNTAILGRLWCQSWQLATEDYDQPFTGQLFIYADDSIVTRIDFNGMEPYVFVLNANRTGTGNTGDANEDRKSKKGNYTYPKYKIFLNDPDNVCFPSGKLGEITSPTTISGCPPTNFCINVKVDQPGSAQVLLDLNGVTGYQAGTKDRLLSQSLTAPGGCIPWDGKDGLGNLVTGGLTITTTVEFYNGLTNLPIFDVEANTGGFKVYLVRPSGPTPQIFWDDSYITSGTVNLTGVPIPDHKWDWTCCTNKTTDYGNGNTINTWWYTDSTRSITQNIVPPSIAVKADTRSTAITSGKKDTTICGSLSTYALSGQVITATGGIWTTTGTGTFSPSNTSLTGTYNITAADRTAGMVQLILTSTGNGTCAAVRDTLILRFQTVPTANAGAAATVCANNPAVSLSGSFANATGAVWSSGGSGTFSPSTTSMTATYTPSAADITAGNVTLTLTTTGNQKCSAATSTKAITIQASPTANAGPAQALCSNNAAITLAGTVTNATSQVWSGGSGTYTPNANTLNAVYTPTAAEITAGSVTFTLTASRAGCNSVTSTVTHTFYTAPTANAGSNQSVCFNNPTAALAGSGTGVSTTYTWSGGTGTFTPNNTTLNASYKLSNTERNNGSLILTLTANRAGCNPVPSTMTITVTPAPVVSAGADGTVCANKPAYTLSGTSSTGSGTWSGSGTFFPNVNTLNAVYTPTATELSAGLASVVLTSANNNNCLAVTDTMLIVVTPAPTANAGTDRSACSNNPAVTLAGSATNASSFTWTGGAGTYTPNNTTLNAVYTPTAAEISNGSISLTLTTSRTSCNPVADQMVISFTPTPTVNAGADQSVCHNNPNVTLNGSVTVVSGGTWSGGSGTFTPNASTLNAVYTPTLTERNSGTIALTLTSATGNGCNPVTDQMVITVTSAPTVNPGAPQSVCANNPNITLSGATTVATGGVWSGGAGTYSPNANTLNMIYTPTAAEISSGGVTLTLTTSNNGNCNPVSGTIALTYTAAPTVNAGTDKTICGDNPVTTLSGSKTVASGGIWTGGAGTFSPNNTTLNASYTATATEINTGKVTLTLTTTGNTSNCNAVSDQVDIFIKPRPTADAGTDQTICSSAANVSLNGVITNAPGAVWTTSGSGSFSPSATTLNAAYVPSAADKTAGTVTLTITTTGMSPCNAVNDQMVITFTGVPSINAGTDMTKCTNDFPVQLSGSGSPAKWSGGTGTFSNANILNPTYSPGAADITAGTVTLTLTTNPSGACPTVSDQVVITLPPAPVANAGADQTMCGNAASLSLSGTVTNASGGFWSTSGTGSFSPNANTLNASYVPSALDKTNGTVTLTLSTVGNGSCPGVSDTKIVTIQPAIVVQAGPDQTVCADLNGFSLAGASVSNATGGTWTSSGSGTFLPNPTAINGTYNPSAADKTAGTVTLTLSTTGNGVCPVQTDAVIYTITPGPTVNAGADQTICADAASITLNGSFTVAAGIQWTTTGSGTFTPNASAANATYTPSAADKTAGSVTFTITTTGNGSCNPVNDQMILTITPKPAINAGADATVCGDSGPLSLTGTVTVASGGQWTTSGNGTFANASALSTTYTLGSNDIAAGFATLTLTSTGNGTCNAVTDQLVITITPIPTVNAGADRSVCKNNPTLGLLGNVTVAGGGIWSGGAGTFTPDETDLSATYTPTAAELTAGTITLTLTTTANGLCKAKSDQMVITVTPAPTANAGTDKTICADSLGLPLNAIFTVATGGNWSSSGTGNFFPNNATPNATYVPSVADRSAGNVTLTFTTSGSGNCVEVNDAMVLTITPAPTVNAGPDQTVCANKAVVTLTGSKTVASGGTWATSGTGTFANANALSTTYTPSALDKTAGSVTLTLTTTGNGSCKSVSDHMNITITPAPVVNAGADQTVCANNAVVTLNGSHTIASGVTWSGSGNGIFSPNTTTENATYTPSPADITAGTVTLTLTTTGNGLCNAVSDQMVINITPAPTINAGPDQTVCADATGVNLNGLITVSAGGIWTSTGTGVFNPNAATLNAIYKPSAADTVAKTVTLTLTTTGNGNCLALSDQMVITIKPVPLVNASADQTVCGDDEFINLSGKVTNATGGKWTTSGSGFFSPDANTLNAQYVPSGAETSGGTITLTLTSTGMGTCNAVADQMSVTFTPVPAANAGPDQSICANKPVVTLNGSVTNATGGLWVSTGDGTFANDVSLSTTYTPSAADIASGSVVLKLFTTGTGVCNSANDQMIVTFTPAPTVNAGADQSVCANNNTVTLAGAVTIASGATWTSSGTGSFAPSANTLNATYHPSAADVTAGNVTLTLTSTGNNNCNAVNDAMVVTITPAPTANAGADQSVCANNNTVTLAGAVTVASGGTWTTSGTGTFANAASVNTTYSPSAADITGGNVTLTLTTTGNSNCNAVNDAMVVTITPAPVVNAGADQSVCANNNTVSLNGSVTIAGGGNWTSSGTGVFANANALATTYTPSAADITAGNVTLTLTSTSNGTCTAVNDALVVTITPAPTVNAGADQSVCANNNTVTLAGAVTVASGATWTSSGTGSFAPSANTLNATYHPSAADITAGNVTLTLTSTGNNNCNAVNDAMVVTITPAPTANAGADQSVCANNNTVTLTGAVTVASGGSWTTSGTGTFANAASVNTTYSPSAADITGGNVTLTLTTTGNSNCNAVNDVMVVTITPAPVVNAGADQSVCANNNTVSLNGSVTIAGGGNWTSSGTGVFANANALATTYTPSAADITAGNVTLTLTSTSNGTCTAVNDALMVTITPAPTVNAGADQSVCANNNTVTLAGAVTIASGATWTSSGTGSFAPSANTLNATYHPSAADITAGNVTLTLTSTGNNNCNAVNDAMVVTITPAPTANAGADQSVCANNNTVTLTGAVTVASGGTWTTSGTGTFANAASVNTTYSPSAADITGGNVTLTLTTTGNSNCNAVNDAMVVTITPAPVVNAGADQSVCANNNTVSLNGSVTIAGGGNWTSSGTGVFANANALATTYTPSAADITAGNVTLTLTSTSNGTCTAVNDALVVTITPAPTVNAGADQSVCANNNTVTLAGAVTVASGATWTSSGTGSFAPSANTLNATYHPSAADITAGNVTLTLTSTGNNNCNAVIDAMVVTITPAPTANAGADQSVCANNNTVTLTGAVTVASGGTWTTSGTGTFANAASVNTTYSPSAADITGGNVTLTLTTTGNSNCNAVNDAMVVTITPAPVVNAGADQSVCANNNTVSLNGSVTIAGGGNWTSSGTGVFANANALATTYTPSAADITAGNVTLTLTSTSNGTCTAVNDALVVTITPAPTVNAGADQSVCANNNTVTLAGAVTVASGATWTSSGTGSFANANGLSTTYSPSAADITAGNVTLTLTSTGNNNCNAVNDAMVVTITPAPTVNPGAPVTVCANTVGVPLNGIVTVATGGTWSTASGTGTFAPDANTLNATFTPSALQIGNGRATLTLTTTGNGNCLAVSATVEITIQPVPVVNAGPDAEVCTGTPSIGLSGTVTNAGGATWTTTGAGTFVPDANTLNATYQPSAGENFDNNVVTLTLTSTGNGSCAAVNDQTTITFKTIPVFAGPDQTVCSNSLPVQLNGSGNGTWSGGTGTFSDPASLSTTYNPAAGEIPGTVTLTLTGVAVGACIPGTDDVLINIINGPVANAGADQSVCANNPVVNISGTVNNATGGTWSTEGSGTFASAALTTTYTASAADIAAGSVRLALVTTGNGICIAASDTLVVTFTATPVVNAGTDVSSCANAGPVTINGSVTVAPGGTWSVISGAGSVAAPAALSTSYNPAAADFTAGSVTLRLTSDATSNCIAVTDDVVITFGPAPTANANTDQNICQNNPVATLNGSVTIASGGTWTSSGTGTFSPNANTLNATYTASAADLAGANVTLTLTTTGNGNCTPVADQMVINFTPAPVANADMDQSVCANNPIVTLNGSVTNATGGSWASSGTGTFSNAASLNATYTASAADVAAGTVTLTLTTTGISNCNAVTDQMVITITPAPVVDAGLDQASCANAGPVTINGSVTVAPGGTWSVISGAGSVAAPAALSTSYNPVAADFTAGSVTLRLTSDATSNCIAVTDDVVITFGPAPTANANTDQNICQNNPVATLNGSVTIASGGTWTSSGTGTFSPNANTLNATYTASAADLAGANVTLTLTTTGNGNCTPVADQMVINFTPAPVANADMDQSVCANNPMVTLNGSVTNAAGGTWTSSGTGTFADPNVLNTTYTPSATEVAAGTATLTLTTTGISNCNAVTDQMVITITPAPVVDAGLDQASCANAGPVTINGSVTVAPGGTWSVISGAGSVAAPAALSTSYNPVAADFTAGSVTLRLTSDATSNCIAVTDDVVITFGPAPTANANTDQNICQNNPVATLNGSVTIASGGTWTSSGTGTFSPNANTLNATYTASAADLAGANVTLTLTTTGNGNCTPVADQMVINFTPAPVANADMDQSVCANNPMVTLNGSVTNATGGTWTSSGTGTFADPNVLNTTYTPSATEVAAGTATLTLTTTGISNCNAVTDQMVITITPAPVVDAGLDQASCANAGPVTINGSVTVAPGGTWSVISGAGSVAAPAALSTSYNPVAADFTAGSVTLRLTSDATSNCIAVTDDVVITFGPAPTVNAGADQNICQNNPVATLNGSVTIASGGTWTSSGTGTFSPNANTLNATYTASAADLAGANVTLTLTTTGNGNCTPVADQMVINFTPAPVANADMDQSVCANNPMVTLNGSVTNATGGTWTSSGTGTFADPNVLNTTYTPSATEVAAGTATLTLTTTGISNCNAVTDQMVITITPAPVVDAGLDQASCANAGPVTINGSVTVAPGGTWSVISGAGSVAAPAALSTSYNPVAADFTAGSVMLRLTSDATSNCIAVTDDVLITFGPAPTVNAGADQTVCADIAQVNLAGVVNIAGGGEWTSTGTGIFTPNANTLNASYVPSAADTAAHTVTLTLTTTGNGNCTPVADQMVINFTPAPTVEAGADQTACGDIASVNIAGTVTVASGGQWTTVGTGTFADPNAISTTYTPSAADKLAGSVILTLTTTGNGTCNPYSDYLTLFFTPVPTINAGSDQAGCIDLADFTLNATTTVATGGTWTTSGTGTFANANALNTTYTPSAADKTAGSVTLTVASTGQGTCNSVSDQMVLNFTTAPVVDAGADRNICADKDTLHLAGKFTVSSGISWTSNGTGIFSPSASDPAAIYYLSPADQNAASLTLTLASQGNGTCNQVTDQQVITIGPKPVVSAGSNLTICAGQANAVLTGSVTNAGGGIWSATGTGSFSNATSLNTTYVPSAGDFTNGGVVLTLTSTSNGLCNAVSDVLSVNIIPAPAAVVNAGLDQTICADVTSVQLAGFVSNAGGGIWSTPATGSFSDPVQLDAKYTPTAADKTAGTITLTLTTTNNGICSAVSDNMTITFTPAPTVTATGPASVCGDMAGVINLNGSVTIATGGIWSSGGTGVFAPDPSTLAPVYYPSPDDKATGRVGLTLTSDGNGTCQPVSKTVNVNITRPPTINAGIDQTVCAAGPAIAINASATVATGGTWVTSGSGIFGNMNALATTYAPSSADTTSKMISLTVTTTGNGTCTPVSDNLKISFVSAPVVNAGPDRTICADATSVSLSGFVANATGGAWTTSGSGNFSNPNSLTASYTPSPADITAGAVTLTLRSTGNNLCSPVTDQVVITIQPKPTVNPGAPIICEVTDGAVLNGVITGASGGIWNTSGSGVFGPNASALNATYYPSLTDIRAGKVTLTLKSVGNGACSATSNTAVLTIDPMPIADAGQDIFVCPGSTVTLAAQTSSGVSYNWKNSGGSAIGNTPDVSVAAVSNESYVLTVTNAKGCASTDTINVILFTMPNLSLDPNYCFSNTLVLDSKPAPVPDVPGIYTWFKDGDFVPGNETPFLFPNEAAGYMVMFSYGNCLTFATTNVTERPKLTGNFIKDCEGNATPVTVKANKTNLNYSWNTTPVQSGKDLSTINITVVQDTTYYVATVTDAVGCMNKDSVRVIGIPKPLLQLPDLINSCDNRTEVLHGRPLNIANLDSLYPSYTWYQNNALLTGKDSVLNVTTTGLYKLQFTIGQCTVKDSSNVLFHQNPTLTLDDYAKFCRISDNKIIIGAGSEAGNTYLWIAPAGISLDSVDKPETTIREEGFYSVVVTNPDNCFTKDSIFVEEICPPFIDVPTAFIPDRPGPDQTFKVFGYDFEKFKLLVFNRWGEVIFMSTDRNAGWDGTYQGEPVPIGVYPWVITYEGKDPKFKGPHQKEGSVTVVR